MVEDSTAEMNLRRLRCSRLVDRQRELCLLCPREWRNGIGLAGPAPRVPLSRELESHLT